MREQAWSIFRMKKCYTINICSKTDMLYIVDVSGTPLLVAPTVQAAALQASHCLPASPNGNDRRMRKVALLETTMLAIMELMYMQNEENLKEECSSLLEACGHAPHVVNTSRWAVHWILMCGYFQKCRLATLMIDVWSLFCLWSI